MMSWIYFKMEIPVIFISGKHPIQIYTTWSKNVNENILCLFFSMHIIYILYHFIAHANIYIVINCIQEKTS